MMKVTWLVIYPVGRDLQIASSPAAIRCTAVIVQRAEDQVVHPAPIPVEAVTSSVNNTLVAASDGSTRAGAVSTSCVGKKDFPNGREGIRRVPIARGLPLLLGRLAQAFVNASLCKIGNLTNQLIGVSGIVHTSPCPILGDDVRLRIYRVLNDRLRTS